MRRTIVEKLNEQRSGHILAIIANGGYFNSKEGLDARTQEIEKLNEHYDELIASIRDPFKEEREHEAMMNDPVMAAGIRGLDRLRWDMGFNERSQDQLDALRGA